MDEELFSREEISNKIRHRFAMIRQSRKLTAQQLADKMDITVQCINQIECGKRLPSMEVLFHFCQVINISLSEFFNEELSYPIQFQKLFVCMSKLNQEELSEITAIIKRIVNNKK